MKYFSVLLLFVVSFGKDSFGWADSSPKNSLYQLSTSWKDQDNKDIQLKDFSGQKTIIAMTYTKCPHSCPMIISKIQEIEREVSKVSKEKFKVVIVSFDVKRDTPSQLKNYMQGRKLDESRWKFLSAPKDSAVRELAVVLGVNYKELEDGEFSHSNVISLLDANGVRLAKLDGLNENVDPIVQTFKK